MNLSNHTISTNSSNINKSPAKGLSSVSPSAKTSGISSSGLHAGDKISGQVIDLKNDKATIRTEDNKTFTARLENGAASNLNIGEQATFEVVNASPTNLALKVRIEQQMPAIDATIMKALEGAGLPKNSRNAEIVKALLQNNLSIDKQMISKLLQQSFQNKEISLETLALMNKHNIPVTKENAIQFEHYRNQEHQIMNEITQITDALPELLSDNTAIPFEQLTNLHDSITQMVSEGDQNSLPTTLSLNPEQKQEILTLLTDNNLLTESLKSSILNDTADIKEIASLLEKAEQQTAEKELTEKEAVSNPQIENSKTETLLKEAPSLSASLLEGSAAKEVMKQLEQLNAQGKELKHYTSPTEREQLIEHLKDLPLTKEQLQSIQRGEMKTSDMLNLIRETIPQSDQEGVHKLLSSKEYQKIIKQGMTDSWTLTPEQLKQDNQVNDLYNRLQKQLSQIDQMVQTVKEQLGANPSLSNQTSNLKNNLDFMNQLNQIFPYVQIPLKLKNQTLNSELYVYTKKKDLKSKTGEVSVLLHLDMEHLKSLDVHVTLVHNKITAKFYMEEKESVDLIAEHINLLEEVLHEKGFLLNTEVLIRQKDVNIVEDFMEKDAVPSSLKRYSFDIRA